MRKFTDEEHYHFFVPDFVSANFEITEIIKAYTDWITEEDLAISNSEINNLKDELDYGRENNKKIEDVLEKFTYQIERFPSFQKGKFAKYLSEIVIDVVSRDRSDTDRKFPFEAVLSEKFFKQIYLYIDPIYKKYFHEENTEQ